MIALMIFASLLAVGCGTSSVTAVNGSKLTMHPLDNTLLLSQDPIIFKLAGDGFIVTRISTEMEILIEKYNHDLTLAWSTPVPIAPPQQSTDVFEYSESTRYIIAEDIQMLLENDKRLVMFSVRHGANDSIYEIGRVFDIASGELLHTKTIDSVPGTIKITRNFRQYEHAISPDSSTIIFYTHQYDSAADLLAMRIVQTDISLFVSAARTVPLRESYELQALPMLWTNRSGDIYGITRRPKDTFEIMEYDFKSSGIARSMLIVFSDSTHRSAHPGQSAFNLNDRNTLRIIASMENGDDLVGTATTTCDLTGFTSDPVAYHPITETALIDLFNDDDYSYAHQQSVYSTDLAMGRYIICFEQLITRVATEGRREYISYRTGNALLMGFDGAGAPTWQQGLRKNGRMVGGSLALLAMATQPTPRGTLRIVYRDDLDLRVVEYSLKDGTEIPGSRRQLLEMGNISGSSAPATTWLDEDTLLLLLQRQGLFSRDWSLGLVQMK